MTHYQAVMQWVYLPLCSEHGLTTFSGSHTNFSLLFPMEQVFEDFLVASFRRLPTVLHGRSTGITSNLWQPLTTLTTSQCFQLSRT